MRFQAVSKMGVRDRIVLGLLRAPARSDRPDAGVDAFLTLATLVRDRGGIILSTDSPYATGHELCLLSLLAIHQREQPSARFRIDSGLRDRILACSTYLTAQELILDHATAVRLADTADDMLVADVRPIGRKPATDRTTRPCTISLPARNTLQFKALEHVRARAQVTAGDFRRLGVSRQVTSQLVKRGLIHRLRYGVYEIAADAAYA